MAKKNADKDRRARVEAMRKQQQAGERRRTFLVLGAAIVVVLVLVGVVTAAIINYRQDNPDELDLIGASPADASCGEVITEDAAGVGEHVGPEAAPIDYASAPPSSGAHFVAPEFPAQAFYTVQDRPAMEALVHNLEHGYTVLWYAQDLPADQVEQLRSISTIARDDPATGGKFIVSAWDDAYGELEEGAQLALSHWGAEQGHRQYCGQVSGEAVQSFIADYPASDAPEPGAQ